MKIKLFTKIFFSYVLLILITILTVNGFQLFMVQNYLFKSKEKELLAKTDNYVSVIKPLLVDKKDPRDLVTYLNIVDRTLGTEIWVIDTTGEIIAVSAEHLHCEGNSLENADLQLLKSGEISIRRGQSQYFNEAVIRISAPIIDKGIFIGAVILYAPVKGINNTFTNIKSFFLIAAIFGIVLSIILALLISKNITLPIRKVISSAKKIAEGKLNQNVNINSHDELGELANTFNYMSDKLTKYEDMRRSFVANVSHELRSPITSIQGFIDALSEEKYKDENEKKRYISILQTEASRLNKLVNELLDISKFDSEVITLNKAYFEIKTVIKRAIAALKPQWEKKRINIKLIIQDNVSLCNADEDRIEQVIHNLLENAIRYSPEDSTILISVRESNEEIIVEITDDGPGLSQEEQIKIWERFYRIDKSRSRKDGGTGLGLAIVKEIINVHGGKVFVESEPDKGATFGFSLPV